MYELFNHLWQTTLFAAAIGVIAIALRRHSARTRYWLWFAASVKFLVPFSLLVSLGDRLDIPVANGQPPVAAMTVQAISTGFSPAPVVIAPQASQWPLVCGLIWAAGALLIAAFWLRRWFSLRATVRRATAFPTDFPVPVRITQSTLEPGIFGLVRPVLVLPAGLNQTLTAEQLRAVLAHELSHVRHQDNLTSALHMMVCAMFWFHPLVWWIGARLVEERERACDESVLAQGSPADVYAAGILSVCRFYLESPLPCASGVTGADLKRRIREILEQRLPRQLTHAQKAALVAAVCACVTLPTLLGVLRAQTLPPAPKYTYEVVSIRPTKPGETNSLIGPGPQGGMRAQNVTALKLLTFAYKVREFQLADVPGWARDTHFDVTFTPDKPEEEMRPTLPREQLEGLFDRQRQRFQAVLRDRFGLVLRAETRQSPLYSLTQAKGGHKLSAVKDPASGMRMRIGQNQMTAVAVPMDAVTDSLAWLLGRYVVNNTGLDGPFDFKLEWTAEGPPAGDDGRVTPSPSIFTSLTEQLGLKVEAQKGPVPVFVIEKIEKPSDN